MEEAMILTPKNIKLFCKKVKVGPPDFCWMFEGQQAGGYGRVSINKKLHLAHRVSFQIHYGEFDPSMVVRHICDTPLCVNPNHLLLGTHADNVADRVSRGRSAVGCRNGRSKLDPTAVEEIRRAGKNETQKSLARKYGVDPKVIRNVLQRRHWNHIK